MKKPSLMTRLVARINPDPVTKKLIKDLTFYGLATRFADNTNAGTPAETARMMAGIMVQSGRPHLMLDDLRDGNTFYHQVMRNALTDQSFRDALQPLRLEALAMAFSWDALKTDDYFAKLQRADIFLTRSKTVSNDELKLAASAGLSDATKIHTFALNARRLFGDTLKSEPSQTQTAYAHQFLIEADDTAIEHGLSAAEYARKNGATPDEGLLTFARAFDAQSGIVPPGTSAMDAATLSFTNRLTRSLLTGERDPKYPPVFRTDAPKVIRNPQQVIFSAPNLQPRAAQPSAEELQLQEARLKRALRVSGAPPEVDLSALKADLRDATAAMPPLKKSPALEDDVRRPEFSDPLRKSEPAPRQRVMIQMDPPHDNPGYQQNLGRAVHLDSRERIMVQMDPPRESPEYQQSPDRSFRPGAAPRAEPILTELDISAMDAESTRMRRHDDAPSRSGRSPHMPIFCQTDLKFAPNMSALAPGGPVQSRSDLDKILDKLVVDMAEYDVTTRELVEGLQSRMAMQNKAPEDVVDPFASFKAAFKAPEAVADPFAQPPLGEMDDQQLADPDENRMVL